MSVPRCQLSTCCTRVSSTDCSSFANLWLYQFNLALSQRREPVDRRGPPEGTVVADARNARDLKNYRHLNQCTLIRRAEKCIQQHMPAHAAVAYYVSYTVTHYVTYYAGN